MLPLFFAGVHNFSENHILFDQSRAGIIQKTNSKLGKWKKIVDSDSAQTFIY